MFVTSSMKGWISPLHEQDGPRHGTLVVFLRSAPMQTAVNVSRVAYLLGHFRELILHCPQPRLSHVDCLAFAYGLQPDS